MTCLGIDTADLRVSNVMEVKTTSTQGAPQLEETDVAGRAAALSFNGENVGKNAAKRSANFTTMCCVSCPCQSAHLVTRVHC